MARLYDAALKLHDIDGQSALADRLNESPQTLNNWDRRGISQRGAIKAAGILGCSAQWIITGKGGMAPRAVFSGELQSHLASMSDDELARCENMLRAHFGMEAIPIPQSHPNGMSGDRRAA